MGDIRGVEWASDVECDPHRLRIAMYLLRDARMGARIVFARLHIHVRWIFLLVIEPSSPFHGCTRNNVLFLTAVPRQKMFRLSVQRVTACNLPLPLTSAAGNHSEEISHSLAMEKTRP